MPFAASTARTSSDGKIDAPELLHRVDRGLRHPALADDRAWSDFSMNCGSSEFILEEVVGPAATACHFSQPSS